MTTLSTTLTSLDDPAARAASRVSFQLTYARANDPRVFSAGWLSGPDIPDAYGDAEDTPGEWDGGDAFRDTSQFTEPEWIDRYAGYAINEAIHEALEWLRVDGRCWLDPHGPAEDFIYIQADTLVKKLAELRRTYLADLDETDPNQAMSDRTTAPVSGDSGLRGDAAADAAANRMTFQLTYARAGIHRRFSPGQLSGPLIPCAYGSPLDASGSWEDGDDLCFDHPQRTEEQWINRYAGYAVNEAIHEALEWLRVDGRCWLDPHGPAKLRIYALTNGFIDQLAALRAEQAAPTDGTRK